MSTMIDCVRPNRTYSHKSYSKKLHKYILLIKPAKQLVFNIVYLYFDTTTALFVTA